MLITKNRAILFGFKNFFRNNLGRLKPPSAVPVCLSFQIETFCQSPDPDLRNLYYSTKRFYSE